MDIKIATDSCSCTSQSATQKRAIRWTTTGGMLAALGVCAACCLLPAILMGLGITGAWLGTLDGLAPYKWIFVVLAVALIGYGFYAVYGQSKLKCAAGVSCNTCGSGRSVKAALWIGTFVALSGIAYEYLEPLAR